MEVAKIKNECIEIKPLQGEQKTKRETATWRAKHKYLKKHNTVTREATRKQTQHTTITVRAKQTTNTNKTVTGEKQKKN